MTEFEIVEAIAADHADQLLRQAIADPVNREALVRALQGPGGLVPEDEILLTELSFQISTGRLRLVRKIPRRSGASGGAEAKPGGKDAPVTRGKSWIRIHVADDPTAEPVSGVELHIADRAAKTSSAGDASLEDVDSGEVRSEFGTLRDTLAFVGMGVAPARAKEPKPGPGPWKIARIEARKVRSGDTLESVAKEAGLTWPQLARFNWGTDDPDQVNAALRDHVGCTQRAGRNYRFDDSDDPGIVYVPRPWSASLAIDQTHVIRVERIVLDEVPRGCVWAKFVTRHDYPIARVTCELRAGGAVFARQTTSDEGEVFWDDVPLSECEVAFHLGGRTARIEVPWKRAKEEIHHARLLDAHRLFGRDSFGIQARLHALGYETLGDFQADTGFDEEVLPEALADVVDGCES